MGRFRGPNVQTDGVTGTSATTPDENDSAMTAWTGRRMRAGARLVVPLHPVSGEGGPQEEAPQHQNHPTTLNTILALHQPVVGVEKVTMLPM